MWNIARSAEAMFSRWAVKRAFKFLLKKKLGHVILGDIDLDQLDVQLGAGTVHLSDLALNVDYINQKFGTQAGVIVKEGSIGSLSVKMPWKGKGCQIEADELEVVLSPCMGNRSPVGAERCSGQDRGSSISDGLGRLGLGMADHTATSTSMDVHEGVKTIAKMVKWLLTSFHVKIKRLLVAFDPCLEMDEEKTMSQMTLVLRITETECGTGLSEDVNLNGDGENFLGISRLTNFARFQGAVIELLQMDEADKNMSPPSTLGSTFGERFSGHHPSAAAIPILTGEHGGFSGTLKFSIPWKNGSLDIRKVDSDVYVDHVQLKLQPRIIQWLMLTWESLRTLDFHGKGHMHHKAAGSAYCNSASHFSSTVVGSSVTVTDKVLPDLGSSCVDNCSPRDSDPETITGSLLPGSNLISDWVPFYVDKIQKDQAEEADFGASLDQFFECFDEMRSSQSAIGSSGIWNWTSSVFSAITAASSLASGSLQIPSEQQHVQTNLKATMAGISFVFSFDDENMKPLCILNGGCSNFGSSAHFLGGKCEEVRLVLQVCPQEIRVEATVRHIEVADYFSDAIDIMDSGLNGCESNSKTLLIQHIQAEVQGALPPMACSTKDSVQSNELVATDLPTGLSSLDGYVGKTDCGSVETNDLVKVMLLTSTGVSRCQFNVSSSSSDFGSTRSVSFRLELPPLVVWINFNLMNIILDLWKEIGNSIETKKLRGGFVSEATSTQKQSLRGNIILPNARVILCFPSENISMCYTAWDQFIALNFSSPLTLGKKKVDDASTFSHANAQKRYSLVASHSLHLNVGDFDLCLVTREVKGNSRSNFCSKERKRFSSHSIVRVANGTGSASLISMIWQEGSVTGPWLAKKAKDLAASGNLGNKSKVIGKGYEFASVTTVKDVEESKFHLRREMIKSSSFFLHAYLPPVTVNLDSSLYKDFYCLLNQAIDGLSCLSCDPLSTVEDSTGSQTSLLVECDSVEILIYPDVEKVQKSLIQAELPGSWHHLRLKIQTFELLSVSNIGGIRGVSFLWVGHGEGKLWGSVAGSPDQELLLISCCNSTMRRGDGGGSNTLSYGLAGSDTIHMRDLENFNSFTSITVSCGTIVAVGGRLDWFESISSFFSLIPAEDDKPFLKRDSKDSAPLRASFVLNLVDIGLSYEPYFKNLSTVGEVSEFNSSFEVQEEGDKHVACLLAAASLNVSNVTMVDSFSNDYRIRVQDLGLLLSTASRSDDIVGSYSVENLQKIGYVKVAGEAFVEATLRTNCKNGLLWELECSESNTHIVFDVCHDTAAGLMHLIAQLQQLFSPDVEESVAHLQARWNNVQQSNEKNFLNDETRICNIGSPSSASHPYNRESEPVVFGLMGEICEDAFHLDGNQIHASDSCELQRHISLDGTVLGDSGNVSTRAPECFHQNGQTSYLDKGCIPEIIECFYRPDVLSPSELPATDQSLEDIKRKSRTVEKTNMERENGWYGDTSLRILENHISEVSEEDGLKHLVEGEVPCTNRMKADDIQRARGRIVLKNINLRWRMHAGSDWFDLGKLHSSSVRGRDKAVCVELALFGIEFQYNIYPEGQTCASKLSLAVQDLHLYDNSKDAPWKLVLGYYDSKEHPRESSSKAFKLDLEAVRPDPSTPLDEYRLRIAFLPMLVHLHQVQLDFLISFFGGTALPVEQSLIPSQEIGGSKNSPTKHGNFRQTISEEALLPYFQNFDIWPVLVRVDYTPSRVDLAALRGGKYVELVNLVPWKMVDLQLKHVHAVGVYGWGTVCETIIGDWLEDISQNQIHKLLRGLPTIRSLVAVGSGAAKLVSLPVKSYRKDHRLLKGMQRGATAFLRSISLEAVGLGLHLAAGAHDILIQAESILASIPPTVPLPIASRTKTNMRSNQPRDAQQGLKQACESLSDGLGRSASALVQAPLKSYQRGAGAGSALATAVRAAPAAAIAPASAAAGAVHFALLGVRNSLDPEHKRQSMEKYSPTQPWENS